MGVLSFCIQLVLLPWYAKLILGTVGFDLAVYAFKATEEAIDSWNRSSRSLFETE